MPGQELVPYGYAHDMIYLDATSRHVARVQEQIGKIDVHVAGTLRVRARASGRTADHYEKSAARKGRTSNQ